MAKTLRQLREERDWSQLDMAVRLGVSVNSIYKCERGLAVPNERNRYRLARLFGVGVTTIAFEAVERGAGVSDAGDDAGGAEAGAF